MGEKSYDYTLKSATRYAHRVLPSFAEGHGCEPVDECAVGTLRSLADEACGDVPRP